MQTTVRAADPFDLHTPMIAKQATSVNVRERSSRFTSGPR